MKEPIAWVSPSGLVFYPAKDKECFHKNFKAKCTPLFSVEEVELAQNGDVALPVVEDNTIELEALNDKVATDFSLGDGLSPVEKKKASSAKTVSIPDMLDAK